MGSISQRRPFADSLLEPSSPRIPSAGNESSSALAISRSHSRSAMVTGESSGFRFGLDARRLMPQRQRGGPLRRHGARFQSLFRTSFPGMVALCRMKPRTVYTVLEETAQAHPNRTALQQPMGGGKYKSWTWSEYRDTVRQVAVGLRADRHRERGDCRAAIRDSRRILFRRSGLDGLRGDRRRDLHQPAVCRPGADAESLGCSRRFSSKT